MLANFQACLVGVAIGDAFGLPVELQTPKAIAKLNNGRGVDCFTANTDRGVTVGQTSDDWQLTHAVGTSLLRRKKFDLWDQALTQIHFMRLNDFGFGSGTSKALYELDDYFVSYGAEGRSPLDKPALLNAGNGVAMKVAPLALHAAKTHYKIYQFNSDPRVHFELSNLRYHIGQIGALTHGDPRAWVAAYAVAWIISHAILLPSMKVEIHKIGYKTWLLEQLINYVRITEKVWNVDTVVSDQLQLLLLPDILSGPINKLYTLTGTSPICWESTVFAVAMFLRHGTEFRRGLIETVNSGGDTDSTCSMVGAMIGALGGTSVIPEEWREFNETFKIASKLGEDIFNL